MLEKIVKVPKITQQVEDTQYRQSAVGENLKTPLSRGILKRKGHGKLSIHFTADYPTIETVFRIIISANQLSIYGAVANICEEFEAHL